MTIEWTRPAQWHEIPERVCAGIENLLGAPVLEAVNQVGEMSPGLVAGIRCADGRRAFVNAVGEHSIPIARMFIAAKRVRQAVCPQRVPVPALRAVYNDGDWVALIFKGDHNGVCHSAIGRWRLSVRPYNIERMYDSAVVNELAGLVDRLGGLPSAADDAERVDRIAVLERLKAAVYGAQLVEVAEFAASQEAANKAMGIPARQAGRGVSEQVGWRGRCPRPRRPGRWARRGR